MALSGSMYTSVGSFWKLQLEWSATQDISANTSKVTAKLYWMDTGSSTGVYSSTSKSLSVTVDGSTSTGTTTAGLKRNQKKLIKTYSKTVSHSADGTGSVSLSAWFDAGVTLAGVKYNRVSISSKSFKLNTIPRASSITSNGSWTAGSNKAVSISRASSKFTHTVRWQVQTSAGSWVTVRTATGVGTSNSGAFTTAQNTDIFNRIAQRNSTPSRIMLETFNGSTKIGGTVYKTGTCTAPTASTVSISNPAGVSVSKGQGSSTVWIDQDVKVSVSRKNSSFTHTIRFKDGNSGAIVHSATGVGTSYTWSPTTAEKNKLYAKIPNSIEFDGQIDVLTYYNGVQVRGMTDKDINYRARESSCKPTFSASRVSYLDTNATTVRITGNNQSIIQGKSSLRVTVGSSATAKNGATISRYIVKAGGITKSISAIGNADIGTINSKSNTSITVQAVDSRGFSTTVSKTATVIPYSPPHIASTAKRLNDFESNTTISVKGTYSQLPVGGVNKNKITQVRYRYKKSGVATWGGYVAFAFTTNTTNGTYTATNKIIELDNTIAWDVEVSVTDALGTVSIPVKVRSGKPIFFIDAENNSLGFNDFPKGEKEFMINGRIVFGSSQFASQAGSGENGEGFGAMFLNNSDISGVNGIYMNDISNNKGEGIHFLKSGFPEASSDSTHYDTWYIRDGVGYLNNNKVLFTDKDVLWQGALYMTETHKITPSRSLSNCPNGWILAWSGYSNGSASSNNWTFTYIPRAFQQARSDGGGMQHGLGQSDAFYSKYLYCNNTAIWGHSRNSTAPLNSRVLRYVIAY